MKWPEKVFIYTDGASRGNPGPASLGVYIVDQDNQVHAQVAEPLGEKTNNFAEYAAVVKGLKIALDHQADHIVLKSDSQLLIRQLKGEYKIKKQTLIPLFNECQKLLEQFKSFDLQHIPREHNKKADGLANEALNLKKSKSVFQ